MELFKIDGVAFYHSKKKCKRCGETLRYSSNRHCVTCKKRSNAKAEARAYRNKQRNRVCEGGLKEQLIRYWKRNGTMQGAPTNAMEWELTREQMLYQREVKRMMKEIHGKKYHDEHKYPVAPDENDPNAIRTDDGILMIGRHVASNLCLLDAQENLFKGNKIKAGHYSMSQLTPLITGEFITDEGKKMNGDEMFRYYDRVFPFSKSGVLTDEQKAERKARKEERLSLLFEGKELPPPATIEFKPRFTTRLNKIPSWIELKSTLETLFKHHKTYSTIEHDEGLRVSIALDIVNEVERAIESNQELVNASGEIDKALKWCSHIYKKALEYEDIPPLYLPIVDELNGKELWLGVEVASNGTSCKVYFNSDKEPIYSDADDLNDEIDRVDNYYFRFQHPLPKKDYDRTWNSIISINPEWELLKSQWEVVALIYYIMGKHVKIDTLEKMKEQAKEFIFYGINEVREMMNDYAGGDYKSLTKNAEKYVSVLGYPVNEYSAYVQGYIADKLDLLEGDSTLKANNHRVALIKRLEHEVLNNIPYRM
ncbi:hypothetical protein IV694_004357 [Salmonella enterica]|nr:hypothetical protein [Salmonella enterica]